MGVDHGRFDIFVSEQFLNSTNVVAILEQMGGKAMAKGMATDAFIDVRFLSCLLNGFLLAAVIEMVAAGDLTARIDLELARRKNILPNPLTICIGILSLQCIR